MHNYAEILTSFLLPDTLLYKTIKYKMDISVVPKNNENKSPVNSKKKKKWSNVDKAIRWVSQAEEFMESCKLEEANKACDKALGCHPHNCDALELKASIAMQLADFELAKQLLDKSISITPFSGYDKYLSRAQISTGSESLYFYNKGIQQIKVDISKFPPILEKKKSSKTNEEGAMDVDGQDPEEEEEEEEELDPESNSFKVKVLTHELSSVYCNIAELYMTDLCDEDDAQELCSKAIQQATEAESSNPEPFVIKVRAFCY